MQTHIIIARDVSGGVEICYPLLTTWILSFETKAAAHEVFARKLRTISRDRKKYISKSFERRIKTVETSMDLKTI